MQVMILAAGFGTRLRPYSELRPKPLFPVLNHPLLLVLIKRLQNLGFSRIIVNCHYLGEQIIEAVRGLDGVIVQKEESILGTGGGLRQALENLTEEPLLVVNGDVYHDFDLLKLYQLHISAGHRLTLGVRDCPRFNSVAVAGDKVQGFSNSSSSTLLTFTGIHVVNPQLLCDIPSGIFSNIIDHYRKLLENGVDIHCFRTDDWFWTDIGTPADYLFLNQGLLDGSIPCWREFGFAEKRSILLHPEAELPQSTVVKEWAVIGKARIGLNCRLEKVVIWDNAFISDNSSLHEMIVT